jgi:transcriptional regulator with XRE-family HTH domain
MKQSVPPPINWVEQIRNLRDQSGLTDAEVGVQLGMSKQFTSDILLGKAPIGARLKLKIWRQCPFDLDRDGLLAFLPERVAEELRAIELEQGHDRSARQSSKLERDDWIRDLVALRDARAWTDAQMAADLGVSKQYLSAVMNRKKAMSWGLKVAVWDRRNYNLSRDTLLALLPDEIAAELIELEHARIAL